MLNRLEKRMKKEEITPFMTDPIEEMLTISQENQNNPKSPEKVTTKVETKEENITMKRKTTSPSTKKRVSSSQKFKKLNKLNKLNKLAKGTTAVPAHHLLRNQETSVKMKSENSKKTDSLSLESPS